MENVFDLSHLDKLSSNAKPIWGKMTSQHMVEHLIEAVKLSNGKIELTECMNPPEKLPLMKRFLMSTRPLPKNFVNTVIGADLKPLIYQSLEEAIEHLHLELSQIDEYFKNNPGSTPMNPTFGPLNKEEWLQFHRKHFQHHFAQFGLTEE